MQPEGRSSGRYLVPVFYPAVPRDEGVVKDVEVRARLERACGKHNANQRFVPSRVICSHAILS